MLIHHYHYCHVVDSYNPYAMVRRPQGDGLHDLGFDGLVEAAAWQCLDHFVVVPRLDWFLFWCPFQVVCF